MGDVIEITKDKRSVHKVGSKIIINIEQTQVMPHLNVFNMVNSWKEYNKSAEDFLENSGKLLETALNEAKAKHALMIESSEKILKYTDEEKKKFLDGLWAKEIKACKNNIEGKDKILEVVEKEARDHHRGLVISVKSEIKKNTKGIKLYSKVL